MSKKVTDFIVSNMSKLKLHQFKSIQKDGFIDMAMHLYPKAKIYQHFL